MKQISVVIILVVSVFLLAPTTSGAACTYSIAPDAVSVEWTAFKFTSKAPVKGHFGDASLAGPREAKTLTSLAEGLTMKLRGKSVLTGNPARDVTISTFFFALMKDDGDIEGRATKVEGDDKKGTIHIDVTMNGHTRDVPFSYSIGEDGKVSAAASIDMLDFQLGGAHAQIHKACEEQHIGEDGISKTWTQVDLSLEGKYEANCS